MKETNISGIAATSFSSRAGGISRPCADLVLNQQGLLAAEPAGGVRGDSRSAPNPYAPKAAAFRAAGEGGDLSVHDRRSRAPSICWTTSRH